MIKNNTKLQPPATIQDFPIIGIGASAGGLDAFKRLLQAIPENSGMAFVIVQHLDPAHGSILPEILQRVTKIPVLEITDEIHLAPDHIYVIPPNKMLISVDGVLKLTQRAKKINLSIDVFFNSLAEVHKEFAVGIVLSGTGTDGTLGLKAIKEHGGISIAQNIESATYNGMPQSAINAGVVDFILPPEKIPEQLLYINNTFQNTHVFKEEEDDLPKSDEAIFKQIISIIRLRTGVDFTYYKQPTFHRRIARRITITQNINLSSYLKYFRSDKAEQDALFQDILIPVTSFFRDPKTFLFLSNTIFPTLFKNKLKEDPFRIWVAGCSTGEEVYSIAISVSEYISSTKREGLKVQLFASDISEKAIKKARAGIYEKSEVEKLSEERVKNYFIKKNGSYEVSKFIRDMCIFTPHNFLKDPPFAKMDLISCRNVLIYMDSFLQKKALTTFHYALKENGFLLLGKSESTSNVTELFSPADKHEKIYFRKQIPGRYMPIATERKEEALVIKSQKVTKQEPTQTDFRKSAEAMLLSKFTPASVVVNEQMDIVHIHGVITPFLVAPQGKPTFNLLKMANEGLAFELRSALHKAKLRDAAVTKENIPIKMNGTQFLVNFEIVPLDDTVDLHYLILFTKTAVPVLTDKTKSTNSRKIAEAITKNEQLEKELANTREDMRSVTEDMEATNEELQSANEELQSSNEEMQSLNEEMETTKEELQSTNEELTIVNQELLDKQDQLNTSRLYSDSIVSTIRHPLIVLDKYLRIKTANTTFYKKFNVNELDTEGKLLYEIQDKLWDDTLMRTMLERVLPLHERLSDFEITLNFPSLGKRNLLLNATQILSETNSEQLILLAIEDITEQLLARKHIEANTLLIRNIYMNAPASICTFKGPTHIYELVNPSYQKLFDKRDLEGKAFLDALPELKGQGVDKILDNVYNTGEVFTSSEIPVMLARADNIEPEQRYFNTTMQPIFNEENKIIGVVNFGYDVTEQIMARKQIEASEKRFSNILSQSLMSIAIFKGPEMILAYANEPMLKGLGKGNSVLNKPLLEGVPELKDQVFPKLLADVYTSGVAYEGFETKAILVRNGISVDAYFNFVYQPYRDVDDTITGVTVLATDVTFQVLAKKQIEESEREQKKLSLYLKLATDSAKVGIWSLDIDTNMLEWSNIHKELWGYEENSENLSYEDWHKLILPEDKELAFQKIEESKINHGVYDVEYRISRANDRAIIWIKSSGHYHYDELGKAKSLSGISIDITKQKLYDTKLLEAITKAEIDKEIAENAVMSKQQFLSNMSHEIRTPMNAIIGFAKVLMKTDLNEKQKEYLQAITSSGSALIVLINDILDLAKVDAGKMVFTNSPFSILNSITTILQLFETKIEEGNIELLKEYDSRIPQILLGDSLRLHQILINLLSNAIKFTAKGRIIVRVNLLNEDEEKVTIEIIISDTGIGIPKNKIETIFENFEQASSLSSSLYGGTGLGLAIVKQLVEKQGGTISVQSKLGEGSSFSFTLSFQKTNSEIALELEEMEYKTRIKAISVLIVEDVKLNQLLLRTILDDFKFACDIADNGKAAIEKLATNSYDIILMDLQMPIMNGFEATEYIRNKMNLQIPIIALTADVTTVDLEKCKAVGMSDYISKPIDEKQLYSKIIDLLKSI